MYNEHKINIFLKHAIFYLCSHSLAQNALGYASPSIHCVCLAISLFTGNCRH